MRRQLTSDDLKQVWHKRHKQSRRTSLLTRIRIYYMMVVSLLSGGFVVFRDIAGLKASPTRQVAAWNVYELIFGVGGIILACLVPFLVRRYMRGRTALAEKRTSFHPLSAESQAEIDKILIPLCARMEIPREKIILLREKLTALTQPGQSKIFPSIVETGDRGNVRIIL